MSGDEMNVFASAMSAVAAVAALGIAWMSLKESRRNAEAHRKQSAHVMDASLQSRLDPMYADLRKVLGDVDDGVPQHVRNVLIPFFVLFSDAYAAQRDGLLDERDWIGLKDELAYWAQKPVAREAWSAFRRQTWTEGFKEYVDAVLAGPAAYPDLTPPAASEGTTASG